ncbi:MAG: hypothetical protein MUF18_15665 [Fimbriiglobus sp.]|jgi:hypothetical protein|nr:hypothetical protein [Fimbriiglobus sp.]
MRLSRWKLMAGVLGLSMCGLAALAEPACRSVGFTRRGDEPKPLPVPEKPAEGAKPLPLPVPATIPPAAEVPPPVITPVKDLVTTPLPPPVVLDQKPVEVKAVPLPPVNDPKAPPAVDIKVLKELADIQTPPTPLPGLKEEPKAALPSAVAPQPIPVPAPAPAPPVIDPVPVADAKPVSVVPVKKADISPPAPVMIPAPEMKKVDPVPVQRVVDVSPVPATDSPRAAGIVAKKLKVLLHLSDDKPWFEVRDGEDLVLKVTADAVSLEAATNPSKAASTLTAAGGVTFRTLGGFGTCDELKVVPGTGEVVVTGKVTVTSNWGKAETTATADKMTFRLGTDAGKK